MREEPRASQNLQPDPREPLNNTHSHQSADLEGTITHSDLISGLVTEPYTGKLQQEGPEPAEQDLIRCHSANAGTYLALALVAAGSRLGIVAVLCAAGTLSERFIRSRMLRRQRRGLGLGLGRL
ncbi:hypothetical protein R6Z07F_015991 [Ovis aries]